MTLITGGFKRRAAVFLAAFALVMQLLAPAASYADERAVKLPGLKKMKSGDISSFANWSTLLKRFEAPLHSSAPVSSGVAAWREAIQHMKGLPPREQVKKVNDFLNKAPYMDDLERYGLNGYWQATPERFFNEGGDCKDYALAKYASLRALGFSPDQLRIAVVVDKAKNIPHAILIVNGTDVLDNQSQNIESAADMYRYQPIFLINSKRWWSTLG
jgi:predicted transglutaminase-like cysteine proteinase